MSAFFSSIMQIDFDAANYYRDMKFSIHAVVRQAIVQFLKIVNSRVPVYTGRAKSSFDKMAEYAGFSNLLEAQPKGARITWETKRKQKKGVKAKVAATPNTYTDGKLTGIKNRNNKRMRVRNDIKDQRGLGRIEGRFRAPRANSRVNFSIDFSNVVPYFGSDDFYHMNPYFPLIHLTPWNSMTGGLDAFASYLEANLIAEIPDIDHYIALSTTGTLTDGAREVIAEIRSEGENSLEL